MRTFLHIPPTRMRRPGSYTSDRLADEAAAWVARLQAESAVESDWHDLETWLNRSPAHRAALESMERRWFEFGDHAGALLAARRQPARGRAESRRGWSLAWAGAGLSAAAVGFAAIMMLLASPQPPAPASRLYATGPGQRETVRLDDGSEAQLNSNTRILAYVGQDRRGGAVLTGEAYFKVAKDPYRPFTVAVGDRRVVVVGTAFDVLRYAGRVRVTVKRGLVAVQPAEWSAQGTTFQLRAGQQLDHPEGTGVSTVTLVSADDTLAWRNGYAVYKGQTLGQIAADLSRYFPTPIQAEGSAARLTFSGVLVIDSEDAVLRRLESFLPIKTVRSDRMIVLKPR